MKQADVHEITFDDPLRLFAIFAEENGAVLLDSANHEHYQENVNRYAFIAVDPFQLLVCKNTSDVFSALENEITKYVLTPHAGLPPFQGGVAGYFAYDLCRQLEKIPGHANDEKKFPDLAVGFYDLVIGFDLHAPRAFIFSSGFPLLDESARMQRAHERYEWLLEKINNAPTLPSLASLVCDAEITSNFTQQTYMAAVERAREYIFAGDIFQVNISQCFKTTLPQEWKKFDLYRRLRLYNPAPFAAYLCFENIVIASASPERFLRLNDSEVEARPIKGTRPRGATSAQDVLLAEELMQSQKDLAENTMIVDLLRNDLSRVCKDHTVLVGKLCGLESYTAVHHLVSVITGELKPNENALSLLRAAFPGGSVTGAPKIRAMEIIAELEPSARGPYCGSVGYIGFDGNMDLSIVIRTFTLNSGLEVSFQAGGAVVADSIAQHEYNETLTKAQVLFKTLTNVPEKIYDSVN